MKIEYFRIKEGECNAGAYCTFNMYILSMSILASLSTVYISAVMDIQC